MTASELSTLFRDDPGQVLASTVVPILVAVAQLSNALYHDISPLYPGLFALALVAFAVLATQYNLAAHRVTRAWSTTAERPAD